MPINEAAGYRRSNLTKRQKAEQEAAIYGLTLNDMQDQLSIQEIERMRQILAQHDAQAGKQGIQSFDLNNPPKVPYVYQPYPTLVYDHETRTYLKVHDAAQYEAALDAGYRSEPFPSEAPAVELDEADSAEAARLDRIARKTRKKAE